MREPPSCFVCSFWRIGYHTVMLKLQLLLLIASVLHAVNIDFGSINWTYGGSLGPTASSVLRGSDDSFSLVYTGVLTTTGECLWTYCPPVVSSGTLWTGLPFLGDFQLGGYEALTRFNWPNPSDAGDYGLFDARLIIPAFFPSPNSELILPFTYQGQLRIFNGSSGAVVPLTTVFGQGRVRLQFGDTHPASGWVQFLEAEAIFDAPEPSTWLTFGAGLISLIAFRRSRS